MSSLASTKVVSLVDNAGIDRSQTVKCCVCGHEGHSLLAHIRDAHNMSEAEYISKFPGEKLLSPLGELAYNQLATKRVGIEVVERGSVELFGVGFQRSSGFKTSKPIKTFVGFTHDDGLPAVDPHYVFPAEISRDMLLGMAMGGRIYIKGPTGSGKTTWLEQYAARTGRPFCRIQFHGEMEPSELTGMWFVNEKGVMEYMYSGLVTALRQPSVIVFDEYDSGNPVVTAIANALLEGKPLVLSNKGGERIWANPDTLICATGNTNGMGDETGLYASTGVQSFATMNRFQMFIELGYMDAKDEAAVVSKHYPGLPADIVADMCRVANLVREGFVANTITCVLSTRQLLNWAKWVSLKGEIGDSLKLAFGNQLGEVDRKTVMDIAQRVFGANL